MLGKLFKVVGYYLWLERLSHAIDYAGNATMVRVNDYFAA